MAETKGNETKGERPSTDLYEVVINGPPFHLRDEVVAYEQLGDLARPGHSPEAMFTVTYRNAKAPTTAAARSSSPSQCGSARRE
jgi:hypothetical protein